MTQGTNLINDLKRNQLMVAIRTETRRKPACTRQPPAWKAGSGSSRSPSRCQGANEVIRQLSKDRRVAVGAGTVLSVEDAKERSAGASYLVDPNFDEDVVAFAKKEGVVSIPGACTPTEIYRAHKAGTDIIKLFPFVEIGGLGFLKAVRGPLPFVRYMLCGGATLDNVSSYLAADAAAILIGAAIIRRDLVATKDWNSIAGLARSFVRKVEAVPRKQA